MEMVFTGGNQYVASAELMMTVNIAVALQKPLLINLAPARPCWPRPWRTRWVKGSSFGT